MSYVADAVVRALAEPLAGLPVRVGLERVTTVSTNFACYDGGAASRLRNKTEG
ncbi:MAG TPA: hypothetical protein VGG03_25200 [Thermoanaerobaculia bacterium]|jgi:hypothetical protein